MQKQKKANPLFPQTLIYSLWFTNGSSRSNSESQNAQQLQSDVSSTPAPEPPVYEKQMVDTEQKYPHNGGMLNQSSGVPNMPRPVQPTYINPGRMGNQPYIPPQMARPVNINQNWTSGLFDCMNDGENGQTPNFSIILSVMVR